MVLVFLVYLCIVSVFAEDPDVHREFVGIVNNLGYECEKHQVITEDGYILGLFRIPKGKASPSGGPPVLLFHGLLDSSFTWILNRADQSLPYLLADNGFDVWFGNARGNRYSNASVRFPSTDPQFWNFTFDDFASIDLPTTMKYVLNTTGYKQLSYVGHSQGTTQTFAALSEDKTRSISSMMNVFIGLGPVTTPAHQTNIYITLLTEVLSELDFAFKVLGVNDFLPPFTGLFAAITDLLCLDDPSVCEGVIELICGKHQAAFNLSRMEVMVAHEPGGTSVKNMIHWGQLISSGRFQKFDYGVVGNLEMYNQTTAPLYDISQIDPKLPIALIYGLEDELADPVDVEAIIKTLPTPPIFVKELSTYSHLDFCWAIDAVTQFYQDVISILKKIN